MKKREFTQLPEGEYLLQDYRYNYLAVLKVYKKESKFESSAHLRSIEDTYGSNNIYLFTELTKDEDCNENIEMKALAGRVGMSNVHGEFSLYNWHLISKYSKQTVESDLKLFKIHHKINSKLAG